LPSQRQPRAGVFVDEEEQARPRHHGHLGVITGGFQSLVPFDQRLMQFVGAFQSRREHRRAHAVPRAFLGIQNQQPLRGKGLGIELLEGQGEGAPRLPGSGQCFGGFGVAEQFLCLADQRGDCFVENDAAHGPRHCGCLGISKRAQLFAGGEGDVVDLGKVVVFGGQPEDGGVRTACRCGLTCAGHGCCRLEGRVERSAEQAHLLPSDDHSRAVAQGIQRGCRSR
jgi:hypothetical protein